MVVELMGERMCISCPICGRQISRSKSGTDSESMCPKCGSELNYTVNGVTVSVAVIKLPMKQPDKARATI